MWRPYSEGSLATPVAYRYMSARRRKRRAEVLEAKRARMAELMSVKPILTPADEWLRVEEGWEKGDRHHPVFNEAPEESEDRLYDEATGPRDPHADSRVYDYIEDPRLARVVDEVSHYIDHEMIAECRRKEGVRLWEEARAKAEKEGRPGPDEWQPPKEVRKSPAATEAARAQRRSTLEGRAAHERVRDQAMSARQRLAAAESRRKKQEEEMWQQITREEWSRRRALRRAQMVDA